MGDILRLPWVKPYKDAGDTYVVHPRGRRRAPLVRITYISPAPTEHVAEPQYLTDDASSSIQSNISRISTARFKRRIKKQGRG